MFQCLTTEREGLLLNTGKKQKSPENIILCATALRLVVASGVRAIKSSTVVAVIDTIIEVHPGPKEERLKPLLEELPRTLRLLLEYQPHVERLSLKGWNTTVDFCIDSLAGSSIEAEVEAINSWNTNVSSRSRTPFDPADAVVTRGSPREPVIRSRLAKDDFSHFTEDLIHCLLALVKATNAPIFKKAEAIMTALLYFLKRRNGRGKVAEAALAGINAVLSRTALQKLDLTKRIIKELLPLMKPMWSEQALRDEILITLSYTEAHISALVADVEDPTTNVDLETLIEVMYADYRSRNDSTLHQQYLEEDHLCFRYLGTVDADIHPLNTQVFCLETDHVKSEGLWVTVQVIARFSSLLDKRKRKKTQHREVEGESVSKRARIDFLFDEYSRHLGESRSNARRAALHVIAFSIQEESVDETKLLLLIDKLASCMSDETAAHSVWAMIALAS